MSDDLRKRAFDLYRAPFRYECGYIWDAAGEMVADDRADAGDKSAEERSLAVRVRGWGRIAKLPDAEKLQDTVGQFIAEALTELWQKRKRDPR